MTTISIIIPVFNEANYIDDLLDSLLQTNEENKEIILVDGGSTDNTKETILAYSKKNDCIKYVLNERKYANFAFNEGCKISTGKYIAFIGAHAIYNKNYFTEGIKHLENNECDAVGGPLNQVGRTEMGKAIAFAMSVPIGVGNTEFRTKREKMYVQSVAFAIYKKEVFEKIGIMDEELTKNQDDEFHYRMNANGFRILMVPEMECTYFVRDSLKALITQYFNYGLFKPLVLQKVKRGIRIRHLVPFSFLLYIIALPFLSRLNSLFIIPPLLYFIVILFFTFKNNLSVKSRLFLFLIFPSLHLSYGLGFMLGLRKCL